MTKEELKTEAREYLRRQTQLNGGGLFHCNILNLILGFAEPREKRIAELEKENAELRKTETMLKVLKDRGVIKSWYYNGSYHIGNELPR